MAKRGPDLVFQGKVAIITGASSGIGRATALALAERGAYLALGARNTPALEQLAGQIQAMGSDALAVSTDVTRREQVDALVQDAIQRRQAEVILPGQVKLLLLLNFLSHRLADWVVRVFHFEGWERS